MLVTLVLLPGVASPGVVAEIEASVEPVAAEQHDRVGMLLEGPAMLVAMLEAQAARTAEIVEANPAERPVPSR